jgi:hypothetical protein
VKDRKSRPEASPRPSESISLPCLASGFVNRTRVKDPHGIRIRSALKEQMD